MPGERTLQQGVERFRVAHAPGTHAGGDDPFDEVEAALEAPSLPDGQPPRKPQRFGHAAGELEVPPAGTAPAVEVEGAQRAFVLDPLQDGPGHPAMFAQHVAPPGMDLVLPASPREAGVEGERHPARLVAPVLEQRRTGCEQRLPERGVESTKPRGEHDAVGAGPAHRHGVELQVAEVLDDPVAAFPGPRRSRARLLGEIETARRQQAGPGESEPPRLGDGEGLGGWGHARGERLTARPSSCATRRESSAWLRAAVPGRLFHGHDGASIASFDQDLIRGPHRGTPETGRNRKYPQKQFVVLSGKI